MRPRPPEARKQGDSTLAEWDAARIRAELELQQLTVGSTTYEGPRLVDLVAASGASDWGTLVAHGKGPNLSRDVAPLLLQAQAESSGFLVAINPDDTFRLVLPGFHDSQWVRHLTELTLAN